MARSQRSPEGSPAPDQRDHASTPTPAPAAGGMDNSRWLAPHSWPLGKNFRRELENNYDAGPDDVFVASTKREQEGSCARRTGSVRTFCTDPVGAFPKNGSHCGRFPWHHPPGSRGSSRVVSAGASASQRIRNVSQRRGRARWSARDIPPELLSSDPSYPFSKSKNSVSAREMVRASGCGETGRRDFSRVRITLAGTSLTRLKSGLPAHQLASAYKILGRPPER
jgi:hypothetical protein